MSIQIHNTQNFLRRGGIKFMIYGKRGVGKTPIAATMPKPLFIASESGLASIRTAGVDYVEMTTLAQIKSVTEWLRNPANIAKYDSIVWDSVSYSTQCTLSELKRIKTYNHAMKYYGDLADAIMPFIELIANDIQKNVCVTAWQGDVYHPVTETVIGCEPLTAGKAIGNYLMHFFDVTMHMARHNVNVQQADGSVVQQAQTYLQTKEANGIFARDRLGVLDPFELPNLSVIINKLSQP